jgi:ubiquinone biosynthesis protein
MLYQYRIIVPRNYHLLMRALGIVEGVGLHLNPDFNIIENLKPYARQIISRKYHPYRMMLNMYNAVQDFTMLGSDLPSDLRVLIDKLKKGTLQIEFQHRGLERLYHTFDIVSNRIAFSIVVAALIIGSSLIVLSGIPPIVYNIPLVGLIGFAISGVLALWLLIAILRRGRF